jgi:hypothetical protein
MPNPIESAASRIEPEMARRLANGMRKVRERVSINDLAMVLAEAMTTRDVKRAQARALALLAGADLPGALAPAGTVARDAVLKGGRIEAGILSRSL